jgi:murein DD-endopeptidase MepM/ murein hydrolase activator NlpD
MPRKFCRSVIILCFFIFFCLPVNARQLTSDNTPANNSIHKKLQDPLTDIDLKLVTIKTRRWIAEQSLHKEDTSLFDAEIETLNQQKNTTQSRDLHSARLGSNRNNKTIYFFRGSRELPHAKSNRISSGFGFRTNPVSGKPDYHNGIDLPIPIGTPVYAYKDGVITKINKNTSSSGGKFIFIRHTPEEYSRYLHLSSIVSHEGDPVSAGEIIGYSGSTGRSTGPHLHFEIRINGQAVNPINKVEGQWYLSAY